MPLRMRVPQEDRRATLSRWLTSAYYSRTASSDVAVDWLGTGRILFGLGGETITLRRVGTPNIDIAVRAKSRGYAPEELVGGISQQDREVRILAEDVTFSPPLRPGDKVLLHGRLLNIDSVDASTGRSEADLVFYIVRARG